LREFLSIFNYKEGTQTIPFEKVEESKAKGNGSDLDCIPASQERQLLIAVFFVLSRNSV
jgi:site-specific DNA recombinase